MYLNYLLVLLTITFSTHFLLATLTPQVLKMISPVGSEAVTWHPVSTLVNNVKNKTQENVVKIELQ